MNVRKLDIQNIIKCFLFNDIDQYVRDHLDRFIETHSSESYFDLVIYLDKEKRESSDVFDASNVSMGVAGASQRYVWTPPLRPCELYV